MIFHAISKAIRFFIVVSMSVTTNRVGLRAIAVFLLSALPYDLYTAIRGWMQQLKNATKSMG
jgi:hypothetical protein